MCIIMDKEFLIQLTANLYNLTLLFPKKEPLRNRMREVANEILAGSVLIKDCSLVESGKLIVESEKNLVVLDSFFELAKTQKWVSPADIFAIQQKYDSLKGRLREKELEQNDGENEENNPTECLYPEQAEEQYPDEEINENPRILEDLFSIKEIGFQSPAEKQSFSERQQRILNILKEKEKAQVWEMQKVFPEVTKRTLRRDFEFLLKQGAVKRIGERNETFYQLNTEVIREVN